MPTVALDLPDQHTGQAPADYWHVGATSPAPSPHYKEWSHFVVAGPAFDLLINFSLTAGGPNHPSAPLAPRLIMLCGQPDRRWEGDV